MKEASEDAQWFSRATETHLIRQHLVDSISHQRSMMMELMDCLPNSFEQLDMEMRSRLNEERSSRQESSMHSFRELARKIVVGDEQTKATTSSSDPKSFSAVFSLEDWTQESSERDSKLASKAAQTLSNRKSRRLKSKERRDRTPSTSTR